MVNIICMKWGTKYGPEYVNKLYAMVKRNLSLPFRFVCFTDDTTHIREEVECKPLFDITIPAFNDVSPWRKLTMFTDPLSDIEGKTLFLDLDIVIVDSIDCFFSHSDDFSIIENWTQAGRGVGNSSVYCFNAGEYAYVLEEFRHNMQNILDRYDNEQIYLSKRIGAEGKLNFFPESWCKSFKRHCVHKGFKSWTTPPILPEDAKIIVFHGNPKPSDAILGQWPNKWYKHLRPTKWVKEFWG